MHSELHSERTRICNGCASCWCITCYGGECPVCAGVVDETGALCNPTPPQPGDNPWPPRRYPVQRYRSLGPTRSYPQNDKVILHPEVIMNALAEAERLKVAVMVKRPASMITLLNLYDDIKAWEAAGHPAHFGYEPMALVRAISTLESELLKSGYNMQRAALRQSVFPNLLGGQRVIWGPSYDALLDQLEAARTEMIDALGISSHYPRSYKSGAGS